MSIGAGRDQNTSKSGDSNLELANIKESKKPFNPDVDAQTLADLDSQALWHTLLNMLRDSGSSNPDFIAATNV